MITFEVKPLRRDSEEVRRLGPTIIWRSRDLLFINASFRATWPTADDSYSPVINTLYTYGAHLSPKADNRNYFVSGKDLTYEFPEDVIFHFLAGPDSTFDCSPLDAVLMTSHIEEEWRRIEAEKKHFFECHKKRISFGTLQKHCRKLEKMCGQANDRLARLDLIK